jgi:hypothetical protein
MVVSGRALTWGIGLAAVMIIGAALPGTRTEWASSPLPTLASSY